MPTAAAMRSPRPIRPLNMPSSLFRCACSAPCVCPVRRLRFGCGREAALFPIKAQVDGTSLSDLGCHRGGSFPRSPYATPRTKGTSRKSLGSRVRNMAEHTVGDTIRVTGDHHASITTTLWFYRRNVPGKSILYDMDRDGP